jgi:hypothetical protein
MNAIELETRYRAHNYAPLPVVLTRVSAVSTHETDWVG